MTQEEFLEAFDSKDRDFEMFTKAGNKRCQAITKKAIRKIFGKTRITQEELMRFIGAEIKKVSVKHGEIHDSEPPFHIKFYMLKACKIAGYNFEFDRYDVTDYAY
jgi:hypothetical protein